MTSTLTKSFREFRIGDLVTIDIHILKNGWFRLWSHEIPPNVGDTYRPESPDKLHSGELAVVLDISTTSLRFVRVLSPRGILGWIAPGNLVLVNVEDDVDYS